MEKPPFQFSLAALLLTVTLVARVLALIYHFPTNPARIILTIAAVVLSSIMITGAMYGQPALRTFSIGALVPLVVLLSSLMTNLHAMIRGHENILDKTYAEFYGFGILVSIMAGYTCLGFRWLIERRQPPDA